MKTEVLAGTSKRLYSLIAPIALNPAAIRQNDGVAFKTTEKHTYIVAIEKNRCVGFLPLFPKNGYIEINNYYALNRDEKIRQAMIVAAEEYIEKGTRMAIITQKADYQTIEKCGFKKEFEYVKCSVYAKTV